MSAGRLPLSRERIISAAIALVDEHGLGALSMRKLGAALGVEAMSLYNHVENKEDVLDGMLDAVLREIPLPDPQLPWEERLRALARSFRRAGHDHPGVLPLFGSQAIRSVEGFRPLECAYGILRSAGLGPADAFDGFIFASSFVFGYALTEVGGIREVADSRTLDLATVDATERAQLAEMGAAFSASDPDTQFERGLDLVIAGLRRLVDERTVAG